MVFGQGISNKKTLDLKSLGRKVSNIDKSESKSSILILGESATGKSVSVTGGNFKKLDTNGNIISVEIPSFPLPMVVIDIDNGSLNNIKTMDLAKQEEFLYFNTTKVDEVFEILDLIYEHNNQVANNQLSEEDFQITDSIFENHIYKTIFIDGVHHVWFGLKSNMAIIKSKQNKVNLIKSMSSGESNNIDKMTPTGTEYLPASTVWIKFSELLRKNKKYSNIVCTAGIEKNEWGKTITTKFMGHKNQIADYDVWGTSEVQEKIIQNRGTYKQYFFTANRVRGGISGIKIENFCYDKLQELL